MNDVYEFSFYQISKDIPFDYDKKVIPEIEKALKNVKGDVIRNKVYNYIIYYYNQGRTEGFLDSIFIWENKSKKTKKVYYKITDDNITVKLVLT